MELLQELMKISSDRKEQLFEEHMMMFLEDLGNLKQLKIGDMINVFKQSFSSSQSKRSGTELRSSPDGNKFANNSWQNDRIGKDSEVFIGTKGIKNWSAFRREFTSQEKPIIGGVINLGKKPVAVVKVTDGYFSSKSSIAGFAWDLTNVKLSDEAKLKIVETLAKTQATYGKEISKNSQFQSAYDYVETTRFYEYEKIQALADQGKERNSGDEKVPVEDFEKWYDAMNSSNASIDKKGNKRIATCGNNVVGEWDADKKEGFITIFRKAFNSNIGFIYGKVQKATGTAQTTENIKLFVEALIEAGKEDNLEVTVDVIFVDEVGFAKSRGRVNNRPKDRILSAQAIASLKDDLMKRLAVYKAGKLDTVDDAAEFLQKVFDGKAKKINFAGRTYSSTPTMKYLGSSGSGNKKYQSFYDTSLPNLLAGKPVQVEFESDRDQNQYETLYLTVKLVGGVLKPIKVKYAENGRYVEKDL